MRFCRSVMAWAGRSVVRRRVTLGMMLLSAAMLSARAELPAWMQDVVSATAIESALYRMMKLPGLDVLYPRPPAESRRELAALTAKSSVDAELYGLRARADEQSLDFPAAEADWKLFVAHSQNTVAANLQLADFYSRRLRTSDEMTTLLLVGMAPSPITEQSTPVEQQRSWTAFQRILKVANDQALPLETKLSTYRAWIVRYPSEPSIYAALINLLANEHRFDEANGEIDRYRKAFPKDEIFPLKAAAFIAERQGSPQSGLAIYERSFQPLWPADLVQSYFGMLSAAHQERKMLSDAHAELATNPDDISAASRIFYYYQQQGRMDAALKPIEEYRFSKESRKAAWSADELYTCATLLDRVNQYDEAARYYFALYNGVGNLAGGQSPQEIALAAIVRILLAAPDQDINLGSGNLSMYSDIATTDTGPGYLNGILSLWLNSESPRQEFSEEEKRALPYFHRAKAAELLSILDKKFPSSTARSELHAELIRVYATYGQDATVIEAGSNFLASYPDSPRRVAVAIQMADAYARTGNTSAEFALYDRMLAELAAQSKGMPLTASPASMANASPDLQDGAALPDENTGAGTAAVSGNRAKQPNESALALTVSKAGAAADAG